MLTLNQLPTAQKLNSQYFYGVILQETKHALTLIPEKSGIKRIIIHLDNCKGYNSARTTLQFHDFQVTRLPHPPESPDISPYNFWFFGWSKDQMRGHEFRGADQVKTFLLDLWQNVDQISIISVNREWIQRLQQVIRTNREHYST
jgi:histone-lysine N-methyltransferase SETMAR